MTSQIVSTIESAAVSPQTRRVLTERLEPMPAYHPVFFSEAEFSLMRRLVRALVPDPSELDLQVARQIDLRLNAGEGAGWRFAALPSDQDAYRTALSRIAQQLPPHRLEGEPSSVSNEASDDLLADVLRNAQSKTFDTTDFPLSLWFEGFKVDVIRFWLADPRTMELLHYDGFADQFAKPQNSTPGAAI